MTVLRRVARNVADLAAAAAFYAELGFMPLGAITEDARLATVLGVDHVLALRLGLGGQQLELTQTRPEGAAYPAGAKANDVYFQHIAILTRDIFTAQRQALRAGAMAISTGGPQLLPAEAGGVIAWKFRDPEGHPLELLQMPNAPAAHGPASNFCYDHSAICTAGIVKSIRFYQALGLELQHRHLNHGSAQNGLDGLEISIVEVVAMRVAAAPPHVELLFYHGTGAGAHVILPNDIAADRLVFSREDGGLELQRDPDGHFLLFDGRD